MRHHNLNTCSPCLKGGPGDRRNCASLPDVKVIFVNSRLTKHITPCRRYDAETEEALEAAYQGYLSRRGQREELEAQVGATQTLLSQLRPRSHPSFHRRTAISLPTPAAQ